MPLIECTLGAASPTISGTVYDFTVDRAGRFVCDVQRHEDVSCLTAVHCYQIVDPLPSEPIAKPAPVSEEAKPVDDEPKPVDESAEPVDESAEADAGTFSAGPTVSAGDMRKIAQQILDGDMSAPAGYTDQEYAAQLIEAANALDAEAAASAAGDADKPQANDAAPAKKAPAKKAPAKPRKPRKPRTPKAKATTEAPTKTEA